VTATESGSDRNGESGPSPVTGRLRPLPERESVSMPLQIAIASVPSALMRSNEISSQSFRSFAVCVP
jgi:hypothetical protein